MTEAELLAAIRADPDDPGARLVYADWLSARGDARGELLALLDRDDTTPGGLADPVALDRLLVLAAEHGFPRLPDDPDRDLLAFTGGGSYPVEYSVDHAGHRYRVHYRHRTLAIDRDQVAGVPLSIDAIGSGTWNPSETNVILGIISDAIRAGSLGGLVFPVLARSPRYRPGPLPRYALPARFVAAHGLVGEPGTLAARDHRRWHALYQRLDKLRGTDNLFDY